MPITPIGYGHVSRTSGHTHSPHQRLLHKLNYYGISRPTLYWIKSFLSDRTQHVSINGSHSALANVTSGVPQGSVLGPVLFLLYINDITNQIQSNIRLFADDSIVYRVIRSPADHQILQTDIQMLTDWSKKWQMNFNTSKCHLLTITHKPKPSEFTYHLKPAHLSSKFSPISGRNHRCQTIMEQAYKAQHPNLPRHLVYSNEPYIPPNRK